MLTRDQSLKILEELIPQINIRKHLLATEALMGAIYDHLVSQGKTELGGSKEEWMMAGLLHDGDYNPSVPENKQGIEISQILKAKGFEVPENVIHCMASHNSATGVKPENLMDWALFICDSLTGLIVATALVRPDKKLASVMPESVLKKFKNKGFARGTRREDILLCQEKLGISLEEFVAICLKAMQGIADSLGL